MPDHKTFCAFGAYAVDVTVPDATRVMLLANASSLREIDPSKLVTLNLHKRLGTVPWDEVILDTLGLHGDRTDKLPAPTFPLDDGINVLTVGPLFPGQHVGGIYIERSKFFTEIRPVLDPRNPDERQWPPLGLHTYQFMSSASREASRQGEIISRYHGFHATVMESLGSVKQLEISTPQGKTHVEVDMNDRTVCDDPEFLTKEIQDPRHPEMPEPVLDAQSRPGDQGAIFLSLQRCVKNSITSPKQPPGGGGLPAGGSAPTPTSGTSSETFVNAGAPDSDVFTKSVFERSLTKAAKLVISEPAALQCRLQQFIGCMRGNGNSLDIVADAPGGIQQIDKSIILDIVKHIPNRFTQCRLLGCVTALEPKGRQRMLELAAELGIPVFGTLRAIAHPDFGDMSFHDEQKNGDETVSIVISTNDLQPLGDFDPVDPERRKDIASGRIQQQWLDGFAQVKVEPEDLEGDPPDGANPWRMPDGLLGSHVAATDQIHTSAAGVVALDTGSRAVRCEVLACATLLRVKSRTHGWIYVNIPPDSDARRQLKSKIGIS